MRNSLMILVMVLTGWLGGCAHAMTVTENGQAKATIVISAEALAAAPLVPARGVKSSEASKVRLAANELQQYVERISGAKLAIVGDDQATTGPVILVGASKRTATLGVNIPSGLTAGRVEEAYIIHCDGDALVLAGNDAGPYHGTVYAVSEFLHRQGVRWFLPGSNGEVVPSSPTIVVEPVKFADKPVFRFRTWWCNQTVEMGKTEALWKLRNKMQIADTEIMPIAGDSWLRNYLPDPKLVESKPELFGKRLDGTPDPYMPNLSNPEAAKGVAEKIIASFKDKEAKGESVNGAGFAPDDGLPFDHTPDTVKNLNQGFTDWLGREGVEKELSTSEEWFTFVNRVAEHVATVYPDHIIATNGYANRGNPPEGITLHPNIAVMYAPIWADTTKPFFHPKSWHSTIQAAQLKRWCELSKYVYVYNYDLTMLVSALTPVPQVRRMAVNYAYYAKCGMVGFFNEAKQPYMEEGIVSRYTRARLMWNPNLDLDAHLADFYGKWYGPAGDDCRAFWTTIEDTILASPMLGHEDRILPYVYTPGMFAACEKVIIAAEAKATAEPFKTRVQIDRLTLETLRGYMALREAEFDGRFADAVKHAQHMLDARAKLHAISPFIAMPPAEAAPQRYYSGDSYYGQLDRQKHFQKLHDMTSGKTGDLVAMAAKTARFTLDDAGVGKDLRWYDPGFDRSKWRDIDTTIPFYAQGYMTDEGIPHVGRMWYVFDLEVSDKFAGKPVKLYAPFVTCEAWVWINGKYAGHRPYMEAYWSPAPIDMDITAHVTPGKKNTVAVWVATGMNRTQAPDGFTGRLFLWSPKEDKK